MAGAVECKRINGEKSILICIRCHNEVDSKPNSDYWLGDGTKLVMPLEPRASFCQWCGAPLDGDG